MRIALLGCGAIAVLTFAASQARPDTALTNIACDPPVTILVSTAGATVSCATASSAPSTAPVDPPDDGSASAPLPTPAFPAALKGLKHPPWKVADVDPGYGNGNPLHGKGKDWQAPGALPACANWSVGAPFIRFWDVAGGSLDGKSPGCSFVGIDFTTHGGAMFYGNGGSHVWFDEDDFAMESQNLQGSNVINCSACASASLTRFDFNGNAPIGPFPATGNAGLVQFGGVGSGPISLTVEHGKSYMVSQHVIDGGPGPNQTLGGTIAFNTVYQTGTSSAGSSPAHGEFAYLACGNISGLHEVFNTVIEDGTGPVPLSNTAGLALVADAACTGSASTMNSELGNNVVLMLGAGGETGSNPNAPAGSRAFFLGGGKDGVFKGNSIHDNYFTMSGAYYPSDPVPAGNTVAGNINMKTDHACDLTRRNDTQC